MKTTLDLPDSLFKEVKLRARRDGRKLNDAVAHLLQKGLAVDDAEREAEFATVTIDQETGLPIVECKHGAPEGEEMTADRMAEILLAQEVGWHHGAGR